MTNGVNGYNNNNVNGYSAPATDTLESDTDTPEEKAHTPDPTFKNEPRYEAPETPKKSPLKNGNPMLRLAIPRSAKGRKTSVTFQEEKAKQNGAAKYKAADSELDLSDDEAEQDEVLSLETFNGQDSNLKSAAPLDEAGSRDSNNCTDIVPLFPASSKKTSMTDLVPVEKVESRSLTSFASGLLSSNKTTSFKLPLTGPGIGVGGGGGGGGGGGARSPYSFSSPHPAVNTTAVKPVASQPMQAGGSQQGVLKLNVAIAGEFSMGNFSPGPNNQC